MFSDSYSSLLSELHNKEITYTEFLIRANHVGEYHKWCKEHCLKPTEDNAELFFDMHGYEESEMVVEFIETGY